MNRSQPYQVTTPGGKIPLLIMNQGDKLPAAFALMGTCAARKVAVRVLGGCKGMSGEDKEQMLSFFSAGFAGFQGVILSGGTRMVRDGEVDPMVTDVPGMVALENKGCVALGTMPRTDILTLQEDSRLVLDKYGNAPNPDMSGLLIVQNGADGSLAWDGDVATYFDLMQQWRDFGGFSALATVAWNGGPVTLDEIKHSAKRGWPTILVRGSGRATDDVLGAFDRGEVSYEGIEAKQVMVVDKQHPATLRETLQYAGILN